MKIREIINSDQAPPLLYKICGWTEAVLNILVAVDGKL